MNWFESFDSRSLSGLLTQAQKSIDKVLDIPTEEGDKNVGSRGKPLAAGTLTPTKHQGEKSADLKTSGSWLSGQDSFWGSITQTVTGNSKKEPEKERTKLKRDESSKKKTDKEDKEGNTAEKVVKTSRPQNSKRNNRKSSLSKKKAGDEQKKERKENNSTRSKQDSEKEVSWTEKVTDFKNSEKESISLEKNLQENTSKASDTVGASKIEAESVKGCFETPKIDPNLVSAIENERTETEEIKVESENVLGDSKSTLSKGLFTTNDNEMDKEKDYKLCESREIQDNSFKGSGIINGKIKNQKEKAREDTKARNSIGAVNLNDYKEGKIDIVGKDEELDSFCSHPVAASTPCTVRTRPALMLEEINEDNRLMNHQNSLKESEILNNVNLSNVDPVANINNEARQELKAANPDPEVNALKPKDLEANKNEVENIEVLKTNNEELRNVVEVRESKLVELSKENLSLQETNAILRSQIEQLEENHKSEDAEFEQMKEEFTGRISIAENKLQAAAKERDSYKKQLEETQRCLSSDNERQLKEFQYLSKEKDEQIAQLMAEGEKLSKEVLQCNTNIKKLRAKEKESNQMNHTQSTRLEQALSEIERLTGILKERDEHKKQQDDAIKKLNTYVKKQDEIIAKQKVELEEASAKLPSLQTALDNAYKEITELHKVNAAKSNEVQEATLSVEMTAKEELRIAMEKMKKESQKECDVLAIEVTDLQTQLSRSEQQAVRREDNLRQEIADLQMRLQEAETRNQELTQSVSVATRPLLRQIENLQHSYGSQQTSWEKIEKNLTERLVEAQSQQASAQEKERAATERSMELNSRVAALESQVGNFRQEKSRLEAELEIEKVKSEALEEFKIRETGKVEALKAMHSKKLEAMLVEKTFLEQQLVVERTKLEAEQKKLSKLEEQLREKSERDIFPSKNEYVERANEDDVFTEVTAVKSHSRNTSTSSQFSLSDTTSRGLPTGGGTAVLEELRATIRHREGELSSMQSNITTLEASRESLTKELTTLMTTNERLLEENDRLRHLGKSFQELQTKYNALLQMYGEKQEETEELKLDLQDIKIMYKAQIQELLSQR